MTNRAHEGEAPVPPNGTVAPPLEAVLGCMSEGVLVLDGRGRLTYINPAATRIHGFPPADEPRHLADLLGLFESWDLSGAPVAPEDWPGARLLGGETFSGLELRVRRNDTGDVFYASYNGTLVRDATGTLSLAVLTFHDVTAQKRAEEALHRFRMLSQHSRDIVLFIRPDGRIAEVNDAAVAAYGHSRDELLRMTIFDLRDPATAGLAPGQMLLADERGITFETSHLRKDGSTFPVEVSSRGALVAGERMLLSIIRDITDRRRAEEALRESEARYRELFENANDILYTLDMDRRITSVNRRAERVLGYSRDEVLGHNAGELVPREYHLAMQEALRRKLAGEETPTVYEVEMVCKDGRRIPVEISSRLILRDSRPVGVQGIARDISERRRAEESLRESEERLRLALDAGKIGAWDWDIASNRVTWSDRIYEFHGLQPGTFGGRVEDFADLVHPDDAVRVSEAIRQAVEERQPYEIEFRIVRPTGEVRWINTSGRVFHRDGRPVRMIGATLDVTDRRSAEDALREADRRKDEFLAMLAHELRNPLAPIRTAVQLLNLVGPPLPQLQQVREMIGRQVAHMARLVDDLLDVSRITRGKILLRKERVDLVPLVRAAVEDHRPLLEGAGLRVSVELPREAIWVTGDPTRLAQVVGNLLHNANKFTDAGGQVSVRVAGSPGKGMATVTVRDTGIGMDGDILARLFEPFSQADRSLDRSRGGLGLGLALVKGLLDLHGGTVRAASSGPGSGSEFVLELPVSPPPVGAKETARATPSGRRPLRVLIIEDSRDAAESLRMLLELSGYRVTVAHAGKAGLEAARESCPDVVICDIGLPGGMDGYAVAHAMRQDSGLSLIPLIALSGYGQEEDQRKARRAGFDRHLTKPVDPAVLLRILEALPGR